VQRVLASGHFILGRELERFEKDFEEFLGAGYVAGCASGTEAIYLALAACDIGPGDEVLVVAHTAVPTISAISMTGATPVFVDIDGSTLVMDVSDAEARVTDKTKAIIPVHLYGQTVNMDELLEFARKHKLRVIEDCAQSTGATFKGTKSGTMGDFSCFSFYPSKNLGAFGDGGAVATNSRDSYDKLVMLRNYGQSKRYYHDIIGINSRMDEIQAAILSAQIPYVNEWNTRRREIADRYTRGLKNIVAVPVEAEGNLHVYHLYVIQTAQRDELQSYLLDQGIQSLIHYPIPAHLQKAYAYLGGKPGDLPATERAAKRILSLPIYPGLTDEQVDAVIAAVQSFYREPAFSAHPVQQVTI
ncbi:MAG: DegT/DnrJ/EryC1/StrS family aminotransferase, partial [Terriglobales bacterium]